MQRPKKRTHFPLSRLLPNMITMGGLCCGLSSIRFAMDARWEIAVTFIIAAAIIDGMDGRVARLLNSTSDFGAQLDSLSDVICFGIAPAMVMYLWGLHEIRGLGWALTLFFSVCCALRLARFNSHLMDESTPEWTDQFFTGIPAPAGGLLCLLPLILTLHFGEGIFDSHVFVFMFVPSIAVLMISRIPTYSGKHIRIRHDFVIPVVICILGLMVFFVIEPWGAIILITLLYLLTMPFSIRSYFQLKNTPLTPRGEE